MHHEWISADPAIMMGKPVIAGTRITVELILEKLGAGESFDQVLDARPQLTRPALLAALGFATKALGSEIVFPMTADSSAAGR